MTNFEATAYARIALVNLLENRCEITTDNLLYEMCALFDLYDEDSIKNQALLRL